MLREVYSFCLLTIEYFQPLKCGLKLIKIGFVNVLLRILFVCWLLHSIFPGVTMIFVAY